MSRVSPFVVSGLAAMAWLLACADTADGVAGNGGTSNSGGSGAKAGSNSGGSGAAWPGDGSAGTSGSGGAAGSGAIGGSGGSSGSGATAGMGASGGSSGAIPSCSANFSNLSPVCGTSIDVTWSCTNATSCSYACTGDTTSSGTIPCTGSTPLTIQNGITCTITGKNGGGLVTAGASVNCDGRPSCSVFLNVPGPPSPCPVSGTASWNCVNATACSYDCTGGLGSGAVACNGSLPINLNASSSCTLTATNASGTATVGVSATCP